MSLNPEEEVIARQISQSFTQGESQKNEKLNDIELHFFNPNALDANGFMDLGFSEKQAASLIKYRNSLGGNFSTVEEFKNAYVVSDKMFERLSDYLDLKPYKAHLIQNKFAKKDFNQEINFNRNTKLKPFFINQLSQSQIMELGFSERQSEIILNFKNSLPGKRFENAEQFKKCYVVNDYMFNRLQPYLRFEKSKAGDESFASNSKAETTTQAKHISKMKLSDWKALGFDAETASNILKYADFIGGFKSLEDLEKCRYITDDELESIRNKILFD
ncbi:MAG: helix-hairpin-helix domain-containing protein [Flavobacteriaceae bacterium]|nr:helix-hairpin-helix domain-containing protein [Flavobacteriaceae bacterium]